MDMTFQAAVISILQIILINAVLSGDNAAVIGMAVCHLPQETRVKAALLGTVFAIILRIFFTVIIANLLTVPYLRFIGGVLLLLITYKLVKSGEEDCKDRPEKKGFMQAVWIIVIADLSMSFDNVLAIAGAAGNNIYLIIIGLVISMPILIFLATWLSNLMNKYPLILWLGAAVLVKTALEMMLEDGRVDFSGRFGISSQLVSVSVGLLFFAYNTWRLRQARKKLVSPDESGEE